jgi:hypothetical protein
VKIYSTDGKLRAIVCNGCGKKMVSEQEVLKEESLTVIKNWGYFSRKDGETHEWDLCEDCYDKITEQFCYPVTVTEQTELV